MRIAYKGGAILTLLALLLAPAGVSQAQVAGEVIEGYAGSVMVDAFPSKPAPVPAINAVAYDNSTSPPNFGVSSTDLLAVWGDQLFTTNTGILSGMVITLFNTGASLGPVLTSSIGVELYDGVTATFLGAFTSNVNFGAGLMPGFFSTITITNLDPFAINLNVTDIVVLQTVLAKTGTANRLGIASLAPITVGSSPNSMYIDALTIGGGVAGFYTFANGPANPGYQVSVALPPVGTTSKSWGAVKKLYR